MSDVLSRKRAQDQRLAEALQARQEKLAALLAHNANPQSALVRRQRAKPPAVNNPERNLTTIRQTQSVSNHILLGNQADAGYAVALERTALHNGLYVLGLNGTGKSSLLEYMLLQHARDGDGFALLDPHGDLTDNVLGHIGAAGRLHDVVYLDLTAAERVFGLNIFECADPTDYRQVDEVASAAMSLFTRLWGISRSETPRLKMFLRHCSYTLIYTSHTLAEMYDLLTDATFRQSLVARITNPQTRRFWRWYDALKTDRQTEVSDSTLNKIDELLVSPFVQAIVGQQQSTFNVRQIMDEGKILLVRLDPKYEDISNLVGIAIVNRIRQATLSRREIPERERRPFYLYADEFHRFVSRDFATQIDEGRKYRVGVVVAHQRGKQLGELEDVPEGVINAIIFKVTDADAQRHAGRFDYTPPEPVEPVEEERQRVIPTVPVPDPLEHLRHNAHQNPRVNELLREIDVLLLAERSAKEARQQEYDLRTREEQDITTLNKQTFHPESYRGKPILTSYIWRGDGKFDVISEDSVRQENIEARRALAVRQHTYVQRLGDSPGVYISTLREYFSAYLLRWLYGTIPEDDDSSVEQCARYMYDNLQPIFAEDQSYPTHRLHAISELFTRLRELGQLLREDKIYKPDSQEFVIEYPQTPYREQRRSFQDVRNELQNALTTQRKFTARYRFDTDEGMLHTVKPPDAPRLPTTIVAALVAHYPTVAQVAEQIDYRRSAIISPPAHANDIPPTPAEDDDEETLSDERVW